MVHGVLVMSPNWAYGLWSRLVSFLYDLEPDGKCCGCYNYYFCICDDTVLALTYRAT